MRISDGSGATRLYECASPMGRQPRTCTNAHLPWVGSYALVRMCISQASGATRLYVCVVRSSWVRGETALDLFVGHQPITPAKWCVARPSRSTNAS